MANNGQHVLFTLSKIFWACLSNFCPFSVHIFLGSGYVSYVRSDYVLVTFRVCYFVSSDDDNEVDDNKDGEVVDEVDDEESHHGEESIGNPLSRECRDDRSSRVSPEEFHHHHQQHHHHYHQQHQHHC